MREYSQAGEAGAKRKKWKLGQDIFGGSRRTILSGFVGRDCLRQISQLKYFQAQCLVVDKSAQESDQVHHMRRCVRVRTECWQSKNDPQATSAHRAGCRERLKWQWTTTSGRKPSNIDFEPDVGSAVRSGWGAENRSRPNKVWCN